MTTSPVLQHGSRSSNQIQKTFMSSPHWIRHYTLGIFVMFNCDDSSMKYDSPCLTNKEIEAQSG